MLSNEELEQVYKLSFGNLESIKKSKFCGCFYCLKIFNSNEIKNLIVDNPKETALCPYCSIDSVLGDNDIEINSLILNEMKMKFF